MTPFLFVGNNRYQTAGFDIGRRSRLDAGRLLVWTAPSHGRHHVVRNALRRWGRDGEVSIMDAPLHYKSRLRSLGVVVPERNASHPRFAIRG